jgi:hypothetical protein
MVEKENDYMRSLRQLETERDAALAMLQQSDERECFIN